MKIFLILFAVGFCFSSVLAYAEYRGGGDAQPPPKPFGVVLEEAEDEYMEAKRKYAEAEASAEASDEEEKSLEEDFRKKANHYEELKAKWERFLQEAERPIADTAPEGESEPESEGPPQKKEDTEPRWRSNPFVPVPYEGIPEDFMASLRDIKPEVQIETGSEAGDVSQTCTV